MQKLWKNSLGLWYSNNTLRLGRTNKRRNGMESVEFAILDWIQQHLRCGFLDTVLPAVSWICNHGEVWIILAAVLLLRKRDRWVGVSVALALVLDASFPSGHTAASFAAVFALKASGSRLWKPALVLAAAIAFSRLYLYVHWPSDVLFGAVLGTALGYAGAWLAGRFRHRLGLS